MSYYQSTVTIQELPLPLATTVQRQNFATLLTRTMTEPRFPLCLIVSTNGITELQQKHCLFLPHEESHTAALPLAEIFSKLCALVEHNPDAFERIVERSYITALGSLDEECAFRNESHF